MSAFNEIQFVPEMTEEEKTFFSRKSRFQDSEQEMYFALDIDEASQTSPLAFPDNRNCWESTRGAKLRGCTFEQEQFTQDLVELRRTEGEINSKANSKLSEGKERERVYLLNHVKNYIVDFDVLLDFYRKLEVLVNREGWPD